MPHLKTAQEWLEQSTLLLKARPTTVRITTQYKLSHPSGPAKSETPATTVTREEKPRAILVLKTYCPVSGVSLKYETTKQQEVGRLVQIMAGLGRLMAGLPERTEVEVKEETEPAAEETKKEIKVDGKAGGEKPGAGKKSKKKGKR